MSDDNRSLKFSGQLASRPYDAQIEVTGSVTGIRFGTLLLTRNDLIELGRLSQNLIMQLDERKEAT